MFFTIYASKNNTITDVAIKGTSKTGSNSGRSEVLELFVLPAVSSSATFGKSRALMQFDLTELSQSIVDGDTPSTGVTFKLRLRDAPHVETLPSSFDLVAFPLSKSWDEGRGLALVDEKREDGGFSNWIDAQSLVAWDLTGSDFITSSVSGTQHFDFGDENLEMDVTNLVYEWLTGGLDEENNGLVLKYIDAHETGNLEFFTKKFFSRHAHKPERIPRIEALWEDFKQDDRSHIHYGVSGSLFLYRIIDGFPQNAAGSLFVDIINSSSTVVQTITSSLSETGIYEASGVFVTLTSSTQIYRDVWFTANVQLFTGTFAPTFASGSELFNFDELVIDLPNLKRNYNLDQTLFVRVLARMRDYKPALRRSGSIEPSPIFLKEAFYEITNEQTEEVLIPFSTGSVKFSKLSYDGKGNYFELRTNNLVRNGFYRIKIRADHNNQTLVFDKDWFLKIT